MKSTYKRVDDLLGMVHRFHKQLAVFYAQLSENSDRERVQMLLQYMSRHERNFAQAMAEYDKETADKLLDTWIQYAPDRDVLSIPQAKDLDKNMTVDDVVKIAMELDEHLARFYSEAARSVDFSELKDFFCKLQEQEQADKAELARNAEMIKHY